VLFYHPSSLADFSCATRFLVLLFNGVLSDEDMITFCFDHFHETYEKFASGMSRIIKIHLLIEDCYRQNRIDRLLTLLSELRPNYQWDTCLSKNNRESTYNSTDKTIVNILVSDINLDELTTVQREGLLIGFKVTLASVLNLHTEDVRILNMQPGSIQLTISLPARSVEILLAKDSHFLSEVLGIQKVSVQKPPLLLSAILGIQKVSVQEPPLKSRPVKSTGSGYGLIEKIERAQFYAQEPERIHFVSFSIRIIVGRTEHRATFHSGVWNCDCSFFQSRGICIHTRAIERVLSGLLDESEKANNKITDEQEESD
jgi:hypothetical protein